ncbi:MAG: hypothetical protein LBS21_00240 [Clostridiales bacterium]|jgi:hypothetical protein|nr:hypothetical protein [Clostridiales bacterium]
MMDFLKVKKVNLEEASAQALREKGVRDANNGLFEDDTEVAGVVISPHVKSIIADFNLKAQENYTLMQGKVNVLLSQRKVVRLEHENRVCAFEIKIEKAKARLSAFAEGDINLDAKERVISRQDLSLLKLKNKGQLELQQIENQISEHSEAFDLEFDVQLKRLMADVSAYYGGAASSPKYEGFTAPSNEDVIRIGEITKPVIKTDE